jgi:putative chitinase
VYWQGNGLSALADARAFVAITRRINGGTNGLADRQMYYARALAVLVGAAPRAAPLGRGHEAIVATLKQKATGGPSVPAKAAAPRARAARPVAARKAAAAKKVAPHAGANPRRL